MISSVLWDPIGHENENHAWQLLTGKSHTKATFHYKKVITVLSVVAFGSCFGRVRLKLRILVIRSDTISMYNQTTHLANSLIIMEYIE